MQTINFINEKDGKVIGSTTITDRVWNGFVRMAKGRRVPVADLLREAIREGMARDRIVKNPTQSRS